MRWNRKKTWKNTCGLLSAPGLPGRRSIVIPIRVPTGLRKEGWFLLLPVIWLDLAALRGRAREKTGVLGLASVKKRNTWKGQGEYFLLLQCLGFLLNMNRIWGKV